MPCQEPNKTLKIQTKTIKIFAFLVCVFGFWFLSFDFVSAGWAAGKYGSAINFDGTNDYVSSNSNLTSVSAFSHSLWFKSSDGAYSADEYLFSQGTNDPSVYLESTDNKVKVMADGADKLSSTKTVNNTQWRHLEITADGTNLKLYLDGSLESSIAYTGSSAAGTLYVASSATPGSYFGGIIDDVKVYSYARTSDEVLTDYNNGKAAHLGKDSQRDDGLVGYWNMEEGKGQTVYDRSGNANNGTLGANSSVAKDDPVFTSGYSSSGPGGTALKFDGVDDYVITNTDWDFTSSDSFTLTAWIKPAGSGSWDYGSIGQDNEFAIKPRYDRISWFVRNTTSIYEAVYWASISNDWYYIVGTRDAMSGEIKLYVNGIYIASNTVTGNLLDVNANFQIGRSYLGINYFNGSIDEVRIYNRALSADEIRQHYNQKKPILEMKFDEGSGTTTKDDSFNNNDAAFPAADANKPTWSAP